MSIVTMAPPNEKNSWKFIEFFHSSYFYCSPYNAHKNCVISEFFTALCCFMANNLHFIANFFPSQNFMSILQQSQWNLIKIILLFFVISFPPLTFVMRIIFLCNFGVALKKGMQFLLFNKHQTEFFHGKTWGEYFWCFYIASLLIYWVNMWFKFLINFILKILQENLFNKILLS